MIKFNFNFDNDWLLLGVDLVVDNTLAFVLQEEDPSSLVHEVLASSSDQVVYPSSDQELEPSLDQVDVVDILDHNLDVVLVHFHIHRHLLMDFVLMVNCH